MTDEIKLLQKLLKEVVELEKDKKRLDWLEETGNWADKDQFLVRLEENWNDPDLRVAVDYAMGNGW